MKITKSITLPSGTSEETKNEIGNLLVNEILRFTAQGKSPVEGETFKKLNKKYANEEHKGDRTPRLRLEGDLMEALDFKTTSKGITIGIMDDKEQDKADGHNNFSGKSKLPQRRFIPGKDQSFKSSIQNKVERLLRESREATTNIRDLLETTSTANAITQTSAIDAFINDFLDG